MCGRGHGCYWLGEARFKTAMPLRGWFSFGVFGVFRGWVCEGQGLGEIAMGAWLLLAG